MILNPFPLVLPYAAHLGLLSAPFRRELPKIPTDIPRSKLVHLQGYCQSSTVSKKGRLKSLKLQVGQEQLTLKIPKLLGHGLYHQFVFGQPLRVIAKRGKKSLKAMFILPVEHLENDAPSPEAKPDATLGSKLSRLANLTIKSPHSAQFPPQLSLTSPSTREQPRSPSPSPLALITAAPAIAPFPPQPRSNPQPVQIQVCSKGNCKKRGSCQFAQEMQQQIRRSGLESQIQVQMTGCLKQCKQAPNLKLKPQGQIFSQVKPQDIPRLLDKCLLP